MATTPTVEIFQTLMAYNQARFEQLWDSIMHLTDEQFVQEIAYAHGSVRNQMVHVTVVETRWLQGLKEQPGARTFTLEPADYPTRQSARTLWETTAGDTAAYVAQLDDNGLARTPRGMGGPVWQVLAHLVNHGTDHRAQVLRALHDFGVPTFDQDLILHLWQR